MNEEIIEIPKHNAMVKFPKIGQFKNVVSEVKHRTSFRGLDESGEPIYDSLSKNPTLKFRGSIKLHGTNAGVIYTWNPLTFEYDVHIQSRNNVITPTNDNAGFATFMHRIDTDKLLTNIMKYNQMDYTPTQIKVFGEWCGGNIQSGVAITGLEKMFVIFAIKIDNIWVSDTNFSNVKDVENKILNIFDFKTFEVEVDFNEPKNVLNDIIDMTISVEDECPFGKEMGVDNGVGEGIVFRCVTEGYTESRFWFKSKGEKHAGSSRVKTNVRVDVEKLNSIKELVSELVTVRRLDQGFEYLKEQGLEISRKNIGKYIKWVIDDVVSEELDTIIENGFVVKEIAGAISNKARDYFFEKENDNL